MTVADLVTAMEKIAPTRLAEAWDNVGLIVGDPAEACERVLLCIDLTPAVLAEAVTLRCQAVVAYHPPVFEGVKRLVAGSVAFDAARRGVAVYSPHTALDVAAGGTNDVLCEAMGARAVRALKAAEGVGGGARECKLVTFVPGAEADAVAEAMFEAGAGRIGEYQKCSFRSEGTGTFLGGEGTKPAVGEAGRLERSREVKIETVVPLERVAEVVAALRKAHPYEEPAFDLVTLAARPEAGMALGVGRVGEVEEQSLGDLVGRLKGALGLGAVLVSGDPAVRVRRVAVCAGAGRSLVGDVLKVEAEVYVTGELPHHDALRLQRAGVAAVCTLHSNSERGVLKRVAERLSAGGFVSELSERDRDPFTVG